MNKHESILFLEVFDSERWEKYLKNYNLRNIAKELNCFKNPNTSHVGLFQNTVAVETSISDFYKIVVTALKVFYT